LPLGEDYVKQLKAQSDLQFSLTLKFMNEDPAYEESVKLTPEQIEALPKAEREALKNKVTDAVNRAIEKAKEIAQEQRPITAPMGA
jgi:hypothetical protein